jgi:hypothetical protein
MRKRTFIILAAAAILIVSALVSASVYTSDAGTAWVSIDPVQCGGNPWENSTSPLPYDPKAEPSRIMAYYQFEGITVFEVKSKPTHEIVCRACSCPRGDTLYLLVSEGDVMRMESLGFVLASDPSDTPLP